MRLLYRVLLLAYPRRFRAEYGGLMWEMFRIQYHRASADPGALGRFRFWLFAIDDLARNALSERAGRWSQGHRPLIAPLAKSQRSRTPLPSPSLSIGLEMIQDLLTEARHAVRRLAQSPSFSLLAILITALGIGANSAMFSFVNAILLRPPAYERADEVVAVYQDSDDGEPNSSSFPAFRDIQSYDEIFSETIALLPFGASLVTDDGVEPLATEWVTAGYFSFLGLAPTMGRDFGPQDDVDGGEPVAVLSYAMWQERYGSDPDILGERLNVNGAPVTIVGVGPQGYGGILPGFQLDTWLSISAMRPAMGAGAAATLERRADHWFQLRARLADGVTTARAQSAMDQLAERLAADYPEYNAGREITVFEPGGIRIHPDIDGQLMPLSVGLMVVVALVLFIACSNLASLLLLRGYGRAQDVAIRLALGASRMRVVCHVVTESVLLSVAGGAVGLALAMWATRAFASIDLSLPLPGAVDLRLDWRGVAFTMALSLLTGVLFGLLPGLRIARSNAMERLRDDAASMSLRGNRFNLRNLLVVGQVAVSFVILVAAGLFLRSLGNAQQAPLGFDSGRLALISTNAAFSEYSAEEGAPLLEQLRDRIAALPGVEEAALTAQPPVRGTGGSSTLVVEGYTPPTGTDAVEVMRSSVGPRYFSTIGAPILHGRAFTGEDIEADAPVAVVSETFGLTFFGTADAVGRRFRGQGSDEWVDIVGVAADVKIRDMTEEPAPLFYGAFRPGTSAYVIARTNGNPRSLLQPMRAALDEVDPLLSVSRLQTFDQHLDDQLASSRLGVVLLSGFGLLGLGLAGLGLFAVVAFTVERRTTELGIRMAIGAQRGSVVQLVLREVMTIVGVAVALGLALSLIAGPVVAASLYGVSGNDPITLLGTAALLALAAALAAWLPARRAASVDPVLALRHD